MEIIRLIAIVTPILITAATVYLRLFVRNEIHELVKSLRDEFVTKEVFETRHENYHDRLLRLESSKPSARR